MGKLTALIEVVYVGISITDIQNLLDILCQGGSVIRMIAFKS